jgi:hypothetical protein
VENTAPPPQTNNKLYYALIIDWINEKGDWINEKRCMQ